MDYSELFPPLPSRGQCGWLEEAQSTFEAARHGWDGERCRRDEKGEDADLSSSC